MGQYRDVIIQACLFFPLIAFVFSLPYILYNYRKYGSFLSIRIAIVYSFILYLVCAYFLVILPLPSKEWVAQLTTPKTQLHLFQFIKDIQASTSLSLSDPSTYLQALNGSSVYQVLFNLALSAPFGMYLRYYFKCDYKKTLLFSFLLALFFELTQLSGLYGYYARSYRIFDVDDLLINTIGGMLGYLLMKPFMKVLPTREEIDKASYNKGTKVSLPRRMVAFLLDCSLIFLISSLLQQTLAIPYLFFIILVAYFIIVPLVCKGRTFGKLVTNTKVSSTTKDTWYQSILRYVYLYVPWVCLPICIYHYLQLQYDDNILHLNTFILLSGLLFAIIIIALCFVLINIASDKYIYYESLSKTKIISTIEVQEMENAMNKQIPYYDIIMRANPLQNVSVLTLPDGYTYKMYEEDDEKYWMQLEYEVDEFKSIEDAQAYFDRVFKPHPEELKKRMCFILDDKKNYVATASAWFKEDEKRHYALLHWVSVSVTQQGKGLGKAIVQYVLDKFKEVEPNESEIFLHTQTWSYKAVLIYAKYGFKITKEPLLKETTNFDCIPVLNEVLGKEVVDTLIEN